jgi:hypothetical protein
MAKGGRFIRGSSLYIHVCVFISSFMYYISLLFYASCDSLYIHVCVCIPGFWYCVLLSLIIGFFAICKCVEKVMNYI